MHSVVVIGGRGYTGAELLPLLYGQLREIAGRLMSDQRA